MTRKTAFVAVVLLAFVAIGNAADMHEPFERASKEFGVPQEIVQGVAYVTSGGVQRQPSTFTEGRKPLALAEVAWFSAGAKRDDYAEARLARSEVSSKVKVTDQKP